SGTVDRPGRRGWRLPAGTPFRPPLGLAFARDGPGPCRRDRLVAHHPGRDRGPERRRERVRNLEPERDRAPEGRVEPVGLQQGGVRTRLDRDARDEHDLAPRQLRGGVGEPEVERVRTFRDPLLDEKFFSRKTPVFRKVFITIALVTSIVYPFAKGYLPLRLDKEEALVQQAAQWYLQSGYSDEKLYYLFPYLMIASNKDPFDGSKTGELWGLYPAIEEWGLDGPVPLNTIVFWDSHFGANEARIPLDRLKSDPNFESLKSFYPDESFKTLGDYNFEVHIFKRVKPISNPTNGMLYFDFETQEDVLNANTIAAGNSYSGGMRSSLGPEVAYGAGTSFNLTDMFSSAKDSVIKVRFQVFSQDKLNDVLAVCSIESDGTTLQWDGFNVNYEKGKLWQQAEFDFRIKPQSIKPNSVVKIYLWNRGKSNFQMDDMHIQAY
ncbi:MAG: hypothetical protein ACKOYC_03935, partial [Bacteroidota bacterium]